MLLESPPQLTAGQRRTITMMVRERARLIVWPGHGWAPGCHAALARVEMGLPRPRRSLSGREREMLEAMGLTERVHQVFDTMDPRRLTAKGWILARALLAKRERGSVPEFRPDDYR